MPKHNSNRHLADILEVIPYPDGVQMIGNDFIFQYIDWKLDLIFILFRLEFSIQLNKKKNKLSK